MNWRERFAQFKYHYDISASFLGLVNFILLSITASIPIHDFLKQRFSMDLGQHVIVGILTLALLVGFMLFGWILDNIFHYWQNISTIQNQRNPQIEEILQNTRKILEAQK